MSGSRQKATIINRPPIGWQMQFAHLGQWYRTRVTCIVCGITGYPGHHRPNGWQASCLLGHPDQCPTCGARFVKGGLSKHQRCKSGHPACPQHVDTQHRRLQRDLAEAVAP